MDEMQCHLDIWKRRIELGLVSAITTMRGHKCSAKLSLMKRKIYLHCLQNVEASPIAYKIKVCVLSISPSVCIYMISISQTKTLLRFLN